MNARPWLVAAIGTLAVLLSVPAIAAEDADEVFVATDTSLEVAEALRKFADTAEKKGYVTLARRSLMCIAGIGVFGTGFEGRAETRLESDDAAKLTAKTRAGLEKQFDKLRSAQAAQLASEAATLRKEAPESRQALLLARAALRLDPESEKARAVLGHVNVKGWGWVTEEDAARLKAGEVPIADGWRSKKGLGKDPRPWGEQWRVTSDHFVIHSNLPLARVFAARDRVEQLRERFLADWEGTLPLVDDEPRHEVYVFAKKSEYEAFLNENDPQHIKGIPGQYSPQLRRSTFFDVESLRAAGQQTSSLEELMLHECTHQLFHELVRIDAIPIDGNDSRNAWINEGIAEFYGMHTVAKGGLVLDEKAIRGMLRTVQVKKSADLVKSASELTAMTKAQFQSPDGNQRVTNYATAGFLCLMLSEGPTRGGWQRFVRAFFCEGNPSDAFTKAMGEHVPELDERFAKALRKL